MRHAIVRARTRKVQPSCWRPVVRIIAPNAPVTAMSMSRFGMIAPSTPHAVQAVNAVTSTTTTGAMRAESARARTRSSSSVFMPRKTEPFSRHSESVVSPPSSV